ncbi:alpha/beta hydrolase [Cellulomonas aerilata]|uniref:Alpha/beta hydrolase n=1 Tax=Cellulomonas aerilata TaxID=515326 RepID=A0A512D749_9CELL|nr:alpha/beta hydrolase [Cellulomonas aerilata]GEO32303.1 alpha/beta hydrolase [Cellulomonas aerilata]
MVDDGTAAPVPPAARHGAGGTAETHDAGWVPDVLGAGWSARTLPLRPDHEGEVVATLVRRESTGPSTRRAVLYLHGYVDYFFQRHLGDVWAEHGYDFYALDLRKYGRSLRRWQTPNDVTDLRTYLEELSAAAHVVREEEGHDTLVVMGHSTGGLLASLWAHAERGRAVVDAVVLNSPWFDLNRDWFQRVVLTRVLDVVGGVAPRLVVGHLAVHYGQSLHVGSGGPWEYDLTWKPHEGFPIRAGWIRSIRRGHARLARGLAIDCPVLLCCSTRSGPHDRWHEELATTDSVLDVRHMVARAPHLGDDVTVVQVPDGVHDLALSGDVPRARFLDEVLAWTHETLDLSRP